MSRRRRRGPLQLPERLAVFVESEWRDRAAWRTALREWCEASGYSFVDALGDARARDGRRHPPARRSGNGQVQDLPGWEVTRWTGRPSAEDS